MFRLILFPPLFYHVAMSGIEKKFLWAAGGLFFLAGCRGPMTGRKVFPIHEGGGRSMVRLAPANYPRFSDDGDRASLISALGKSAAHFRAQPSNKEYRFAEDRYSAQELAASVEELIHLAQSPGVDWDEALRRDFAVYASVGSDGEGTVTASAYYEHSLRASLTRGGAYVYPLYSRPPDLKEGSPFFTREEIDSRQALAGRGLELAWAADPLDIFFLQVQGTGWLLLPDGEKVRVRFSGHNGRPFQSVGGAMIARGLIPKEKFSRRAMVEYLASHPDQRSSILNLNPRYVFFKIDNGPRREWALGSLGVPLTPERSVALDPASFPLGAVAWLETHGRVALHRFVVGQDEGGAIKGPGRVDYFVGGGADAEARAVQLWERGRLYFIVLKKETRDR